MTDAVTKTAYVRNDAGFEFSVYLVPGRGDAAGNTWFNFSLPSNSLDIIDSEKAIHYRIDRWPAIDVSKQRTAGKYFPELSLIEVEPQWVNFRALFLAEQDAEFTVRQFQRGSKLIVRYFLFTGGYKETSFDLAGARTAIASALGIASEFSEDEEIRRGQLITAKKALGAARSAANSRCGSAAHPNDTLTCTIYLGDCVRAFGEDTPADIEKKIECLGSVRPYGPPPAVSTPQRNTESSETSGCSGPKRQTEDTVASQIKQAAQSTGDPELSKALWAEYRRYMDGC